MAIKEIIFAAIIASQVGTSQKEVESAYKAFIQDYKIEKGI